MDIQTAAKALDGNQYGREGSKELFAEMAEGRLVAVFGYSDDNMEFRGAIYDEVSCYDGGTTYITNDGLLENPCSDADCPYHEKAMARASEVEAIWCPDDEPGLSWVYVTDIPHETFLIKEDEETYCRGIVFSLDDVPLFGAGA
jgi:hypothetical protein